jgi:predicted component of type VI protein secretion system
MSPMNMQDRLRTVKARLTAYEGRLKELEGRLKVIRGQAAQAQGRAKAQLVTAERRVRETVDATLKRMDGVIKDFEPRVRRALEQTKRVERSVRVGIKSGAAAYRQSGRKSGSGQP